MGSNREWFAHEWFAHESRFEPIRDILCDLAWRAIRLALVEGLLVSKCAQVVIWQDRRSLDMSSRSSSAENLSSFFKAFQEKQISSVQEGPAKGQEDPAKQVMEALKLGPQSIGALVKETGLRFESLTKALADLQKFGLVQVLDSPQGKSYELTSDGVVAAS